MQRPMRLAGLVALVALPASAEQVNVFAAASMKTALDEVAALFTETTGNEVVISYAGSNALAKQIIDGAPADIYISANTAWMDEVEGAGMIAEDARRDILGNTLVLIAHDDIAPIEIGPETDLKSMIGDGKLAMALVDSVPAGQYGKAALESLGLWASVEGSVAQADNVRAALALVALNEAPYGIVYATDAAAEDRVHVAGTFPADSYPTVTYPTALLTGAADQADRDFFAALSDDTSDAIFAENGFKVLD
ncbi:MAG TPA: molybdate ABC transporter substrate-binding protein [Paracoccus sp. (in: a-proteobacteria)]|mgnify:CR=1 FL=1|uniref:molybdate ABC transporter substrate-binding protein n=1 Tax=uncultured Paracoccus sp. TaxID=189685 RepID=UPI0026295CC0|nr:molybdate ABC transporter substrate-binding protein [uncultured Paracoccus sp.]HMQ42232.1 molybdate ABC transporter substrate-binding protein [Paracoccus sp. (in: a-proteobacteria)]HMR35385.1 molybdate ABC transporter substrate-binding protein [Paracoccus sp. (in: a-proteobacteria)]